MDGSKVERVLDGVLREIERLGRRRIAATELARAKQYWQGRLWLGLEETQAVAAWYGAQEILYRRIVSPQEVAARVGAVTADDVLRVARFYLSPQRAKLTAVGPVSRDRLETRLACA
jgi:predicted Zn-dependent peptidase